jgi:hypothetical protein
VTLAAMPVGSDVGDDMLRRGGDVCALMLKRAEMV